MKYITQLLTVAALAASVSSGSAAIEVLGPPFLPAKPPTDPSKTVASITYIYSAYGNGAGMIGGIYNQINPTGSRRSGVGVVARATDMWEIVYTDSTVDRGGRLADSEIDHDLRGEFSPSGNDCAAADYRVTYNSPIQAYQWWPGTLTAGVPFPQEWFGWVLATLPGDPRPTGSFTWINSTPANPLGLNYYTTQTVGSSPVYFTAGATTAITTSPLAGTGVAQGYVYRSSGNVTGQDNCCSQSTGLVIRSAGWGSAYGVFVKLTNNFNLISTLSPGIEFGSGGNQSSCYAEISSPLLTGTTFTFTINKTAPSVTVLTSTNLTTWTTNSTVSASTFSYTVNTAEPARFFRLKCGSNCSEAIVGYAHKVKPAGKAYMLLGSQFTRGNNRVADLFASAPSGTTLVIDGVNHTYSTTSGWNLPNTLLPTGKGYFLNSASTVDWWSFGFVKPQAGPASMVTGNNMVSFQSPRTSSPDAIGINYGDGTSLLKWDITAQSYVSYDRYSAGWLGATPVLGPLEGFYIQSNSPQVVQESAIACP